MLTILEYLCLYSTKTPISKYHIMTKIIAIRQQRPDRISMILNKLEENGFFFNFLFCFFMILIIISISSFYVNALADQIVSKKILLIADENILKISPDNLFHPGGIYYDSMTFNGSIVGPTIEVDEGELFQLTIRNDGELVYSIDFHGINGPSQSLSGSIAPGTNKTIEIKAEHPGIFVYHCDGDNLNGIGGSYC
jgi:hypothetical protein